MKTSRLLLGALFLLGSSAPAFSQPEPKIGNDLPYPIVSLEDVANLLPKTSIRLHLTDATVKEALEELERQSGQDINTDFNLGQATGLLKKMLSLDLETTSFDEAAQAIFDKAEVRARLYQFNEQLPWLISPNPPLPEKFPTSGEGPLTVHAVSMSSSTNKEVSFSQRPSRNQSGGCNVALQLDYDQRLPMVGAARLKVTRAEDEQGRSLIREDIPGRPQFIQYEKRLNIGLQTPPETSRTLAHLEGSLVCLLSTESDTWEVPDLLNSKGASHEFNAGQVRVRVTIKNVEQVNNSLRLEMQSLALLGQFAPLTEAPNPLTDLRRFASMISVVDANGRKLRSLGGGGNSTGNEATVRATFVPAINDNPRFEIKDGKRVPLPPAPQPDFAGPLKVVIKVPTKLVQTEVPFSFTNLPLP